MGFAFCSELRSLVALPRFPRRLDERGIAAFLSLGYVPDPLTAFAGVAKLPPGHVLVWSAEQGAAVRRYWTPVAPEDGAAGGDEGLVVERLRDLLADAVGSHLESEVPLGAFLSGGLDSSAVVALMKRSAVITPRTFAIGFAEDAYTRPPCAPRRGGDRRTPHRSGSRARRGPPGGRHRGHFRRAVRRFLRAPHLSRVTARAPTRDRQPLRRRGDELFGGYTRYLAALQRPDVPAWGRPLLRAAGHALPHITPGGAACSTWHARVPPPTPARSRCRSRRWTAAWPPRASCPAKASRDILGDAFAGAGTRDFVSQMMLVDVATYLPGDIPHQGRPGEHGGLARGARAVARPSASSNSRSRCRPASRSATASASRSSARRSAGWYHPRSWTIPSSVSRCRSIVVARPLRHRIDGLATANGGLYDFLDRPAVRRLVREHLMRRRDHGTALWRALVLQIWLAHLDAGRLAQPVTTALIDG